MPRRDRRRDILQAAEKLFTERRFHEVTTDDVAREAQVGKGTIYKYFADKDELFFETVHAGLEELCEAIEKVPADEPFGEQLLKASMEVSGFFKRKRQLVRAMQSEGGQGPFSSGKFAGEWAARRAKLLAAIAAIMKRGVEAGEVRADVEPDILAAFFLGMLRTRGRDLTDTPEAMRPYELVVDLFRNGAAGAQQGASR